MCVADCGAARHTTLHCKHSNMPNHCCLEHNVKKRRNAQDKGSIAPPAMDNSTTRSMCCFFVRAHEFRHELVQWVQHPLEPTKDALATIMLPHRGQHSTTRVHDVPGRREALLAPMEGS